MKPIVLFTCCSASTPLVTVRRRLNAARWTTITWLASVVGVTEGIAFTIVFGASTFGLIVMIAAAALSLLLAVPAILLFPMADELEREMRARGVLPAGYIPTSARVPGYVLKMMALFAIGVIAAHFVR